MNKTFPYLFLIALQILFVTNNLFAYDPPAALKVPFTDYGGGTDQSDNCHNNGDYITHVNFAGIDNSTTTSTTEWRTDFGRTTTQVAMAEVVVGKTYPISITVTGEKAYHFIGVYIDWNADNDNGSYELDADANEEVLEWNNLGSGGGSNTVNGNITIPIDIPIGKIYMRVMLDADNGNGQFDCALGYGEIEDYVLNVSYPATTTFTGTGNWSDPDRWSDGFPGPTSDAIISGTCTVDGDCEVDDLTITSSYSLTVSPTNILTVGGSLSNNAGSNGLVLQSDNTGTAMLLNNTAGQQATIQQYLVKDQWHYMGIPITSLPDANTFFHNCYMLSSNEATADNGSSGWESIVEGDAINAGSGYAVQYNRATTNNDTTITFSGTLNSGSLNAALSHTDASHGWNFVSNPYPVTIDWNSGINTTNVEDGIFLWNPDLSGDNKYGNYGTYSNGISANEQTQYIAPMQGFFIRTNNTNPSIEFTNASKTTEKVNFKSTVIDPIIRLAITDNDINYDETIIRVNSTSNRNLNATKLKALNSEQPLLYTVSNKEEYTIFTIPEINHKVMVPLEVMIKNNGNYKLVLKGLENYSEIYPLILFNKQGEELANLEVEEYCFEAQKGDVVQFVLAFSDEALSIENLMMQNVFLSTENEILSINNLENTPANIAIYNVKGQCIIKEHIHSDKYETTIQKPGIYLVNVLFDNGAIFNGKAVIK